MTDAPTADAADPLAGFAGEFHKPPGTVYLDGNSLGLLCRPAERELDIAVQSWRDLAVRGWTEGESPWFRQSRRVAAMMAEVLGAGPEEVMVGQSTTVNLHQLLATFHEPAGPRPKILIDALSFPTDRYAVESHLRTRGLDPAEHLVTVPSDDGRTLDEERIIHAMAGGVGFAVLPSVVYTSGQLLDLPAVTRAGREKGVTIAWDCSHSAGVVPHRFADEGVELAFGCTYKYLNGGPGSPGYLYVKREWTDRRPGMAGWFGSDPSRQFDMAAEFTPAADAGRFMMGTPHVLSLAPVAGSLGLLLRAGIDEVRRKSLAQTRFLREMIERRLGRHGVRVVTPGEDHRRGGHVALTHREAGRVAQALRSRGVIPDFRRPDMIRLAPAPLYTSFAECERAIEILDDILTAGSFADVTAPDGTVT